MCSCPYRCIYILPILSILLDGPILRKARQTP